MFTIPTEIGTATVTHLRPGLMAHCPQCQQFTLLNMYRVRCGSTSQRFLACGDSCAAIEAKEVVEDDAALDVTV